MTEADLRSNAAIVDDVRAIFGNPSFQAVIIMLKDSAPVADANDADDPIVSVRKLSRIDGYNECLLRLFAAATPLPQPPVAIPETWAPEDHPLGAS
jgi:hypothetical protein